MYSEVVDEKSQYVVELSDLYLNNRDRFNNLKAYIEAELNYNRYLSEIGHENELEKFESMLNTMDTAVAALDSPVAVAQRRKKSLKKKKSKKPKKKSKKKSKKPKKKSNKKSKKPKKKSKK